jgi:hypothetical protein
MAAVLTAGAAISSNENTSGNVPPSIDRRANASALAGLFDEPRPPPKKMKKKRSSGRVGVAMIGLVPKTGFVEKWRNDIAPRNMSPGQIKKQIDYMRKSTLPESFRFKLGEYQTTKFAGGGRCWPYDSIQC